MRESDNKIFFVEKDLLFVAKKNFFVEFAEFICSFPYMGV
jgi:hypothetical protein